MTEQAVELSIFARPIRRLPPAEKGTKKPGPSARSGMPFSPRMKRAASCPRRCVCCFQAGLLTPGSSSHYAFPLLPINLANSDFCNVRPRLQWRARPGFAPGSHFQPVRAGGNGPPETLGRHHDLLIPPYPFSSRLSRNDRHGTGKCNYGADPKNKSIWSPRFSGPANRGQPARPPWLFIIP